MLGLGLDASIPSQPCRCIPPLPSLECYMELKSGVLLTQSLKCLRGPIAKFLERSKDSLLDVLRRALAHFFVVPPSQTLIITYKKLSFLISIAALPLTALPRQVLQCRLQKPHTKAWISLLETQINDMNLPNIAILLQNTPSKSCWKKCVTKILGTRAHLQPGGDYKCDLQHLSKCTPNFSCPSPLWKVTHCAT